MNMDVQTINQLLQQSSFGRHALEVRNRYDVTIAQGRAGVGTYYDAGRNTVYLDPLSSVPPDVALVHELTHAESAHTGRWPDVIAMNRADYIDARLNEEVDARTNEILYSLRRRQLNPDLRANVGGAQAFIDAASNDPAYQPASEQAYDQAYDRYRRQGVDQDTARRQARRDAVYNGIYAARAAGRRVLYDLYVRGRLVGSGTGTTYPQSFGAVWDRTHGSPGGPASSVPPEGEF